MKALEDMKELLEEQVKKINRKGDAITPQELDSAYKAIDIIKDIETISAMKKAEEDGSREGMSYARGGMSRDMSNAQGQSNASYDGGMSNHYRYPYMMDGWNYGRGHGSYDGRSYGESYANESYARAGRDGDGDSRYSEESYARGRDPRTGRYVSRDSYDGGSYADSYDRGGSYESYARGGRGSYERGYSSADEKAQLKKTLDEMKQKIDQMK